MFSRLRPSIWLLVLVSLAVTNTACSGSQETVVTTTSAGHPMELHSTGAAPRHHFDYRVEAGHRERTLSVAEVVATMDEREMALPEMRVAMDLEVEVINSDRIEIAATSGHVSAGDSTVPALQGQTLDATFTRAGELVALNVGPDAPAELRQSAESMHAAIAQSVGSLPGRPLGVGASWTVADTLDMDGVPAERSTTYRVVAITPTSMDLTFEMTAVIGWGTGSNSEVAGGRLTSSGEMRLSADLLSPALLRSTTSVTMRMGSGSRQSEVSTGITTHQSTTPLP